jgi:hypothetical protein
VWDGVTSKNTSRRRSRIGFHLKLSACAKVWWVFSWKRVNNFGEKIDSWTVAGREMFGNQVQLLPETLVRDNIGNTRSRYNVPVSVSRRNTLGRRNLQEQDLG